jgi:hypothetical protein
MTRGESISLLLSAIMISCSVGLPCAAQESCEDSVFALVHRDTVTVFHTGAYYNCCATIKYASPAREDSIIDLVEIEAGERCYCMCCFDLSVDVTGLESGRYLIRVWGYDQSVFYGQVWVTIGGFGAGLAVVGATQSNCYGGDFVCGDCNGDGRISVGDATHLVGFIHRGGAQPVGDSDVNQDGRISVADANYIVTFLYRNGTPPCEH